MSGWSRVIQQGTGNDPSRRTGDQGEEEEGSSMLTVTAAPNGNINGQVAGDRKDEIQVQPARRAYLTIAVLCVINLLNYMDRFTIAGVLPDVQTYYNIDNSEGGLLQTAFICSYMIFAPIFGYLGDRFNRKYIMAGGILFWSITTFLGSLVPADHFWLFLLCRGLVGVGEASYSTIAPTLIADLFLSDARSKILALFYFAIPVGSGLGYIVGSSFASLMGSWHWALRITPPLGIISVLLIVIVTREPPRGEREGGNHLVASSWLQDLRALLINRSYMWSTLGFTCVTFVAGAFAWWGPKFLKLAVEVQGDETTTLAQISLAFGVVTVVAGIVGVAFGSGLATYLKHTYPRADPLVCAFSNLACTPFLFFAMFVSKYNTPSSYVLIFLGEVLLCMTWAIVADILLYIVIPTRRSTAAAFQILISHAFGDAGSPYIIGEVSDAILSYLPDTTESKYTSLLYAMFISCFICIMGGGAFLVNAFYIVHDRDECDRIIKGKPLHKKTYIANSNGDPILTKSVRLMEYIPMSSKHDPSGQPGL